MKEIKLTKGYKAQVDDEDFEYLNQFNWHACVNKRNVYAIRSVYGNGEKHTQHMHRVIMNCNDGKIIIDHKDMNGLNNQKENLRTCSNAENRKNVPNYGNKKRLFSHSAYKGVTYHTQRKGWIAQITKDYKKKHIGIYKNEIDAAIAYNKAALELHGEYARINEIL